MEQRAAYRKVHEQFYVRALCCGSDCPRATIYTYAYSNSLIFDLVGASCVYFPANYAIHISNYLPRFPNEETLHNLTADYSTG